MYRLLEIVVPLALVAALLAFLWYFQPPVRSRFWDSLFDTGHILVFGLICVLLTKASAKALPRLPRFFCYMVGIVGSLAMGVAVELFQRYVPNRTFEYVDLLNDGIGVLAFAMLLASVDNDTRSAPIGWHRRYFLVSAALLVMTLGMLPLIGTCLDYQTRAAHFPVLAEFSTPWLKRFVHLRGSELEFVTPPRQWPERRHVPLVGRFDCRPGRYRGLNIVEPYPDWRGFDWLELDILVPKPSIKEADSQEFILRVHDRIHNGHHQDRFRESCQVVPGFQTVRFPLSEIKKGPVHRDLDMAHIAGLVFFINELDDRFVFFLGEVRLL